MRQRFETVLSLVLTLSGASIAVGVVHRTFFVEASAANASRTPPKPEYMTGWREIADAGIRMGPSDAKITIVEFGDLECPFCRKFHSAVRALQQQSPDDIALVYLHFPLPFHRFAGPAARVAECAADDGHFSEMVDALFEKQDSLGLKSWTSFAVEAGIRDTTRFATCAGSNLPLPRVDAGLAIGRKIDVKFTPTVIVNGWRFFDTPDATELKRFAQDLAAGRVPRSVGGLSGKGT